MCSHELACRTDAIMRRLYDLNDDGDESDADNGSEDEFHRISAIRKDLDLWTYFPMHLSRPVLHCQGEQLITFKMYDRIKAHGGTDDQLFKDASFVCRNLRCPSKGGYLPSDVVTFFKRSDAVTLLTLERGPSRVHVHDWKCHLCQRNNHYFGRYDGIFPVRKTKAYSCLLYTSPSPRDLSTSRMPSSA